MKAIDSMRRDWNERARHNAFLYIASWRHDWTEESFFASGEADVQRLVHPILKKLSLNPANSSMAELGCGAGRMTRAFANQFQSITAIDISEEMQQRARKYLADFSNIRWILVDGVALSAIDPSSLDFVFSYMVLQHYPSADLISASIREMLRILRPGGAFLFHFNGSHRPTMNWKGRAISAFLDGLCTIGLKRPAQSLARLAGIDPEMIGKTWRGVALTSDDVDKMVREAGGFPEGFDGLDSPFAWCHGRKAPQANS
ncbi:MAG TPA: class I SAM-dependent methyltransferase [Candidatus Dormibacteraeota bacterium]|jgi:SAM-dependent methyltransferase|nr:class I SAM-dependent methyltransferase [Candidatus Dormibacteraeota bacterium]